MYKILKKISKKLSNYISLREDAELEFKNILHKMEQDRRKVILDRLCRGIATDEDYRAADNVTRVRYARHVWYKEHDGKINDEWMCHFMFHTSKDFNGFSDGARDPSCNICKEVACMEENR